MHLAPADVEVNQDLVTRLEQWLEMAKSGELQAAAAVGVMSGRRMTDFMSNPEGGWQHFAIAGALNGLACTMTFMSFIEAQRSK